MERVLENLFLGQLASQSFSQVFRWEDSRRRVRVVFAGLTVAVSKRFMLLHEFGRLPVFYFPLQDVRRDMLEESEHCTHSPLKGEAAYWTLRSMTELLSMRLGATPSRCPKDRSFKGTWRSTGFDGRLV